MTAWVALAIAALSLVVAIVAALYARMQGIATREQAAEARRMRELAEEERHAALTPTFTLALVPLNPGVQEHRTVVLLVTLVGRHGWVTWTRSPWRSWTTGSGP